MSGQKRGTVILHLASFRWVDGVTAEDVERLTAAMADMATKIPVLRSYAFGPNLRLRPSEMDFAVVALVDDEAALHAYLDHPAHAQVYAEILGDMVAERVAAQLPLTQGFLQ